jgi:hypothetical protein
MAVRLQAFGVKFCDDDQYQMASLILIQDRAKQVCSSDLTITPLRIDTETTNNPK